jgi:hypothetical protein
MLVYDDVRRFNCCVMNASEGSFDRLQACVIYIGLGLS